MTSYIYATSAESARSEARHPGALDTEETARRYAADLNRCQGVRVYRVYRVEHEPVVVLAVEEIK